MSEASIPVDPANPGQVFACLGFVEAAHTLLGMAWGGFDWRNGEDVRFRLRSDRAENAVKRVLRFLEEAAVVSLAPLGSDNCTEKWHVHTVPIEAGAFPFNDPQSPATLPACLQDSAGKSIVIDYWGDETRRDNLKLWAGSGGYPGVGLVRDALDLIRGRIVDHADAPFSLAAEQSSSFRFDWRRDYVPIDAGFSPNAHSDVTMQGYPVVEVMAAIGLTHARPLRRDRRDKLNYSYGLPGVFGTDLYDPIFLRAALGARSAPFPGMPFRRFHMQLNWPGQEGQARCITNVIEENPQHD